MVRRGWRVSMYIRTHDRGGRSCRRGSRNPPVVATWLASAPHTRVPGTIFREKEREAQSGSSWRACVQVRVCVSGARVVLGPSVRVPRYPPGNSCVRGRILDADRDPPGRVVVFGQQTSSRGQGRDGTLTPSALVPRRSGGTCSEKDITRESVRGVCYPENHGGSMCIHEEEEEKVAVIGRSSS